MSGGACVEIGASESTRVRQAIRDAIGRMPAAGNGNGNGGGDCMQDPASCRPAVTADGMDLTISAAGGDIKFDSAVCGMVDPCDLVDVVRALGNV